MKEHPDDMRQEDWERSIYEECDREDEDINYISTALEENK